MKNNDTISKTLLVAVSLCLFCSAVISFTAVNLKDIQEANVRLDQQKKILASANLLDDKKSVEELFLNIESKIIDLRTGEYEPSIDISSFKESDFARDANTSIVLSSEQDIATIKRRENYQKVYLHYEGDEISAVILPVRGYGLWGTLYGYIAIKDDFNTVSGIEFYEHKETPGLGAEVDNPKWKASWKGKKIYKDNEVVLSVIKGKVDESDLQSAYKVDGLSGATITSRGVTNMVSYWFGESGYSQLLRELNYES